MALSVDVEHHFLNGPFGSISLLHLQSWLKRITIKPSITFVFSKDHDIVPKTMLDSDNTFTCEGELTDQLQNDLIAVRSSAMTIRKNVAKIETLREFTNIKLMIDQTNNDDQKKILSDLIDNKLGSLVSNDLKQ